MMTVGPEETRLSNLLIRWEEMRELGQDITIDELCAGNSELVGELKRRIAALEEMDPLKSGTLLLSTPPTPMDVAGIMSTSPRGSAECKATYRDLRFHAAGGLGEVFMAHGDDLHRDVALKFMKRRVSHDPDSRRRFLQEAEVTGRLEHPGIVPVYSLGQDEGCEPCYAMRFIRGQTLEEAIREYHDVVVATAPARRNHALRGLIKRLVAVCNTIAYAHSRGVLHRDIKPRNIMLGKYDETLVVDWGLARPFDRIHDVRSSGEETLRPSSGESGSGTPTFGAVGTPAYMSPEQSEARHDRIGPASDVYSLGATLYVILTGRSPVEGHNIGAVLERVRRGDFPPPRQVDRNIPRALDAICRKAMALRIEDRYATALDLAEDLERWLADEPVMAWREPVLARMARWGRGHKTLVASVMALLATAVVAMTVATVLLGRQNEEILRQKALADQQHSLAELNFNRARDAVNRMLTEVGEVELADVPQMEPIRARLLDEAKRFYVAFLAQEGTKADVRIETARAHQRLGDIQEMLGNYVAAERADREAIRLSEDLAGQSADARQDLARGQTSLGVLLKKSNRFQEAEQALRAAIALRERSAADSPGNLEAQQALAEGRYQWGTLLARLPGRRGEDERAYREAIALQEKLVSAARDKPEYRRDLARSLNNLGMLLAADAQSGEAEDTYLEALKIQEALVKQAPSLPGHRWQLARTCGNLGFLMAASRRSREAEELDEKALDLQRTLMNEFPKIPAYPLEMAAILSNLGLLRQRAAPDKAEQAYRQALTLLEGLVARFPNMPDYRQKLAITDLNLAILLESSDLEDAERVYRTARDLQEQLIKEFPKVPEYRTALGRTLYSLSFVMLRRGELDRVRRLLDEAIRHQRVALDANRRNALARAYLRDSLGVLATTLTQQGDHAKAAETAEELPLVIPDEPDEYLRAAAFLARCMALAADDRARSDADRLDLVQTYARRAAGLLRRAVDRGLLRNPHELDHPEFAPLHDRDDFKAIQERLKDGARVGVG